jgi:hypothetical protein
MVPVMPEPATLNASDREIAEILKAARTIAVVGISARAERDSHRVAAYLQGAGYRIVPVNPGLEEVLGERCYPSLTAIPPSIPVDVADVFRRVEHLPAVVEDAIARGVPVVWFQSGLCHEAAAARARAAGLTVVQDRCLKVEHMRLAAR